MKVWVYSRLVLAGPGKNDFNIEIWTKKLEHPKDVHFPEADEWDANNLIESIFDNAKQFQGTNLNIRIHR
jgi:hypothetical protein